MSIEKRYEIKGASMPSKMRRNVLEINEISRLNQMKDNNLNFLLKDDFIVKYLNNQLKKGILSKITKEILPYSYKFNNNELERKLKVQNIINDYNINFCNTRIMKDGDTKYEPILYETGVIKSVEPNREPELLYDELKKIFDFCNNNNITHIFEIVENRYGIEIDNNDIGIYNISDIYNFDTFGISDNDINHLAYKKDDDSIIEKMSDDSDDDYEEIDCHQIVYNDCYVFNEISYSIKGVKVYPKDSVEEFKKCKSNFEYFYKNYIKK